MTLQFILLTIILKVICPEGIITASDSREVYSIMDTVSHNKVYINHCDGIKKTFLKDKYVISICGNAYIDSLQIKDFFPNFLTELDENIEFEKLSNEVLKLYSNSSKIHSTTYYISFYNKTSPESKYYNYSKFEPSLYRINIKEGIIKRLNIDEDGFTYGLFWGGENDKINEVLKEKRSQINMNNFTINSSIELIKEIIKDVQLMFKEKGDYSTIGGDIEIIIQTTKGTEIRKIKILN